MYDQTHGRYVLVQVALPGARQPSGMVSPGGQPIGAPGAVGTRSAQMLRPGVDKAGVPVDPYGAFLEKVPDLDPRQNTMAQQLYPHLVPDTAQVMQQFPPPRPLHEKASDNADPAQDAWGRSPPKIIAPGLE